MPKKLEIGKIEFGPTCPLCEKAGSLLTDAGIVSDESEPEIIGLSLSAVLVIAALRNQSENFRSQIEQLQGDNKILRNQLNRLDQSHHGKSCEVHASWSVGCADCRNAELDARVEELRRDRRIYRRVLLNIAKFVRYLSVADARLDPEFERGWNDAAAQVWNAATVFWRNRHD